MCGITGWFEHSTDTVRIYNLLGKVLESMHHRGPDNNMVKLVSKSPVAVLGHARLAIIDISPSSNQPMTDKISGNTIVFNGELYNFRLLRKEMEALGHQFITQSDTEVILKSYNEWGSGCVKKFRGIFAFALWDKKGERLFMARDQMGVKPFYYHLLGSRFIFASEVRALLATEEIPRILDPAGLDSFLAYGSVQEPLTMIKGIKSLSPGYFAWFDHINGFVATRYWSPPTETIRNSELEITEMVHETLMETAKLQLVSDVPLGIFLSGGIDSSAIVSLVRQVHSGPITTFSITFGDPRYDERRFARMVSKVNDTDHIELELTSGIIKERITTAMNSFDQPSLDGINTWFVSKLAKEAGLTVALSGVGGDELFIGYGGYNKTLLMQKLQPAFSYFPGSFGRILEKISHKEHLKKMAEIAGFKHNGYFLSRRLFSPGQKKMILNRSYYQGEDWFDECFQEVISDTNLMTDNLTRISWYEMRSYMLSTLLRDTDQMSMAHSLEVRVPLIDPEVVQLLLSIPGKYKKTNKGPKPLLVNASAKGIPHECVNRKKQGFTFPFDQYFLESLGQDIISFFNEKHSAIFKKNELNRLWDDYQKGWVSWSRLWALFVLEWWIKKNSIET